MNSWQLRWWRGCSFGLAFACLLLICCLAWWFESGLPRIANVLIALACATALYGVSRVLRASSTAGAWCSAFPIVLIFKNAVPRAPAEVYYIGSASLLLLSGVFAGSIYALIGPYRPSGRKVAYLAAGLVLPLAAVYLFFEVLVNVPASDGFAMPRPTVPVVSLAAQGVDNPALPGPYAVGVFSYEAGTVDASLLLPEWTGFKQRMREWFWGFGVHALPLNATAWYPKGSGRFPLVLIVHGNHRMEERSDLGYAYLAEMLASRGYVAVSVDENFLNLSWSGDFLGREMPARAWLLLQHLKLWRRWNLTPGHKLFRAVDMQNIALIGHSRGGEAIVLAAAFNRLPCNPDDAAMSFDFNFNIRALVAIAPTDRRYARRLRLEGIDYFTIHGGYDANEPSFYGMRQAQRMGFSAGHHGIKAGCTFRAPITGNSIPPGDDTMRSRRMAGC